MTERNRTKKAERALPLLFRMFEKKNTSLFGHSFWECVRVESTPKREHRSDGPGWLEVPWRPSVSTMNGVCVCVCVCV